MDRVRNGANGQRGGHINDYKNGNANSKTGSNGNICNVVNGLYGTGKNLLRMNGPLN